ncbi:putative disease resistance protein RGA3 [Aristolochia californica]|uniref:putative disease resistance protein RGA3 n=1 Tax=Aristolochia californica TaxID=171875 RepID=UPI0035DCC733
MAEIVLSPLLDRVISSIGSALVQDIRVVWGVEEELQRLSRTLSAINSLMADAEEKQLESNTMKDWLRKLKEVVYDAENVVDDFNLDALQAQQAGDVVESKKRKEVHNLCLCFSLKKVTFQLKIGKRIQDIRKRLDEIAKERNQFHLCEMSVARPIQIRQGPFTSPLIDPSIVVGREEEKDKLIKELLMSNESISEKHFSVIPIVGLGGLGKTTFARLVYNNEEVKQYFEVKGWNLIEGKKFLIVIDDVWEDALSYWDDFRIPFIHGNQGSKLIVTTRSEKVSSVMGTSASFHLVGLPDEDCLKLFLRKAFVNGDEERYPNLVDIGKVIVKKCRGVPLAINTLSGLLTFTRNKSEWNGVLDSSFWKLPQNENSILPALRLSYHHLPPKVKPCFAFCSLFPKDWRFDKDELIRMWMALGYIQPDGWREEEVIGDKYFSDLLMISFFSVIPHKNEFTMHDLVHDLAESLAKEECIRLHDGKLDLIPKKNNIPQGARHASLILSGNAEKVSFDYIKSLRRLRTVVALTQICSVIDEFDVINIIAELKFLHVMRLRNSNICRLPNVVGCLRLLRYLDLSCSKIEELPYSICSLSYLQTLNLEGCVNLKKLPNNTATLKNLRHLNITNCYDLTCMPTQIGKLTNLRKLTCFIVGKEAGTKIVELEGLNSLTGKLDIKRLENVVDGEEVKEAGLKNKQLRWLELFWTHEEARDRSIDEDVLENLQPHMNLETLTLWDYQGTYLPSWLSNLPSLNKLNLLVCRELASLPEDFGKLRSLERLWLYRCPKIPSLPSSGLPKSLKKLGILHLPLLMESCEHINGRDWPKIAHIPFISIH